ncbi:ABC transporter substrate-binding protein [Nocardioides sp.]|uniref:ABC transporter substrate-binding protein n=1 Tax=Nocardioides sp. TaxID=35761 RepID=UPI0031FE4A99|nr:amino acid/amide transporter substrate-binding protein family [Nocardioides sp.]
MNQRGTGALAGVLTAVVLALAACGSQLSPDTVSAVNKGVAEGLLVTPAPAADQSPTRAPAADVAGGTQTPNDVQAGHGSGPAEGDAQLPGQPSAPGAGTSRGSCDGFRNQAGVTDDRIVIANASDISGPVPGLFEATQDAVRAFAAYFNAAHDICGRKLEVLTLDTRTEPGADQQAYAAACSRAFAAVGSMAAFDSGGAQTAEDCGLPDLRATIVTHARDQCDTCFATQAGSPDEFPNSVPDYLVGSFPEAARHAAYLWMDAGPARENAATTIAAMEKRGVQFAYTAGIDVAEFNYAPYVQQLKAHHVQWVQFLGAYQEAVRFAHAMRQQSFDPDLFLLDATAYDPNFVEAGGDDVDGVRLFVNFTPFEEADATRELRLYVDWLQQVKPGAVATYDGLFAWSAARLFTEQALALGGDLSRAHLIDRLRRVDNWTDHGVHAPQHVGNNTSGGCWRFLRLDGDHWVPEGGSSYRCGGLTTVS